MDEKKWYGSRLAFFINKENEIVFQKLEDERACRDMMKEDYGYTDDKVSAAYRGHIIDDEISFFIGEEYNCVPDDVVSTYLLRCVDKHNSVFGINTDGVIITNGKVPSEEFNNWKFRRLVGTWVSPENTQSINE